MTDNVKAFMNALKEAKGEWIKPDLRGTPFSIEYTDHGVDLMLEDDIDGEPRLYWSAPRTGATAVFYNMLVNAFMSGGFREIKREQRWKGQQNADS